MCWNVEIKYPESHITATRSGYLAFFQPMAKWFQAKNWKLYWKWGNIHIAIQGFH